MTGRPLLLLDIDGVLNPFGAVGCPGGYAEHVLFPGEEPVRVNAGHGDWLRELAAEFSLVWATAWGEEANRRLAPLLGLDPLPVIPMPAPPFPPAAHTWAVTRAVPTLLIDIDPSTGFTREIVDRLLAWATTVPPVVPPPGAAPARDPKLPLGPQEGYRSYLWAPSRLQLAAPLATGFPRVPAGADRGKPGRSGMSHQLRPGRSNRLIRMEAIPPPRR